MLSLNSLNTLTNLIYSSTTTPTVSNTFEAVNILVGTVLTLLIVLSLILTFFTSGAAVHKVLGLLLVSIFVVFLWMLQTQFLFIYVVYIMAFISAVLMLFLSVVLMLPISALTLSGPTIKSRRAHTSVIPVLSLTIDPSNLPDLLPIYSFGTMAAIVITLTAVGYTLGGGCLIRDLQMIYRKQKAHRKLRPKRPFVYRSGNDLYDLNTVSRSLGLVQLMAPYLMVTNVIPHSFRLLSSYSAGQIVFVLVVTLILILALTIWTFFQYLTALVVRAIETVIRADLLSIARSVLEGIVQTYLYLGIMASTLALLTVKQEWFSKMVDTLTIEDSLGLGQIKELLYGSQSYFLILSTIVLLVALLGAAVMTRNRR